MTLCKIFGILAIILLGAFISGCSQEQITGKLTLSQMSYTGTVYYVSAEGNDGAAGTSEASAWRTIAKVNSANIQPGDAVLFRRGDTWAEQLDPPYEGTESDPVTFGAYGSGNKPVLDGQNSITPVIDFTNRDYMTFKDLTIRRGSSNNMYGWNADYIILYNMTLENSGTTNFITQGTYLIINHSSFTGSVSSHGAYIDQSTSPIVEHSTFDNNEGSGIKFNVGNGGHTLDPIIRYNIISNSGWAGIDDYSSNYAKIHNNIFYGNNGRDITSDFEPGDDPSATYSSRNADIYNNVFYHDHSWSDAHIYIGPENFGHEIYNNIFLRSSNTNPFIDIRGSIQNSDDNIFWSTGTTSNIFRYNTNSYSSISSWRTATGFDNASSYGDPLVQSITGYDYHLQLGSPAIDTGRNMGITKDFEGNTVPKGSGPDIGPYEYMDVVEPPPCVDDDGDGQGTGCSLGSDCDDSDPNVQEYILCNYDGDDCGNYDLCVESCPLPPQEICGNTVDDDCDGQIDEGCQTECECPSGLVCDANNECVLQGFSLMYSSSFEDATKQDNHRLNWDFPHWFEFASMHQEDGGSGDGEGGARMWVETETVRTGDKSIGLELFDIEQSRRSEFDIFPNEYAHYVDGEEYFVSYWLYIPENWALQDPSINWDWYEMSNIFSTAGTPYAYIHINVMPDQNTETFRIRLGGRDQSGTQYLIDELNDYPLPKAQWFRVMYYVKRDKSDGAVKAWFNDDLIGEDSGFPTMHTTDSYNEDRFQLSIAKIYHSRGDPVPKQLWIDDFRFYIKDSESICIDSDGDGYGIDCSLGVDCDDDNPDVHTTINCNYDGNSCGTYDLCVSNCPYPPNEICGNGLDDDCDGFVDEGFALGESCSVGVGVCMNVGTFTCSEDGTIAICSVSSGIPSVETCNGLDDDCDGSVDEGFALGESCSVGVGACSSEGTYVCDDGGVTCTAETGIPSQEICNDIDDDCDGFVDEELNKGASCAVGIGECRRTGTLICSETFNVTCSATSGMPVTEICDNGLDDDCDGQIDCEDSSCDTDEACVVCVDIDGDGYGPGCNLGSDCDANNTLVHQLKSCDYDGVSCGEANICVVECPQPPNESCNGLDDDCDGFVDEGFALGESCSVGVGVCMNVGTFTCSEDGTIAICSVSSGIPSVETCNGLDDDCDGFVDEDYALGESCNLGEGICSSNGNIICNDYENGTRCDAITKSPETELCGNDLDDDCDGSVDEGFDIGQECFIGIGACRETGQKVCSDNLLSTKCDAIQKEPTIEICDDAIDNDCDGLLDCADSSCNEDESCTNTTTNMLSVSVVYPVSGEQFFTNDSIKVLINTSIDSGFVDYVELMINDDLEYLLESQPYELYLQNLSAGLYEIQAIAYSDTGITNISGTVNFSILEYAETDFLMNVSIAECTTLFYNPHGKILIKNKCSQNNYTLFKDKVKINKQTIFVDSDTTEINGPADLTFYEVEHTYPVLYRDNDLCASDICRNITHNLSAQTYTVNVIGFSNYSLKSASCGDSLCNGQETCNTCISDCGRCPSSSGSSGGRTTHVTTQKDMSDKEDILPSSFDTKNYSSETNNASEENITQQQISIQQEPESPSEIQVDDKPFYVIYLIICLVILILIIVSAKISFKEKNKKQLNNEQLSKNDSDAFKKGVVYIKKMKSLGFNDDYIIDELKDAGWESDSIKKVFFLMHKK